MLYFCQQPGWPLIWAQTTSREGAFTPEFWGWRLTPKQGPRGDVQP